MPELTASESRYIQKLAQRGCHPRRIEAFLAERGFNESDTDSLFETLRLRRARLLADYCRKRNVRSIGFTLIAFTVVMSFVDGLVSLFSLALFFYGVVLVVFGSLVPWSTRRQGGPARLAGSRSDKMPYHSRTN
jgi:hypothetical protein